MERSLGLSDILPTRSGASALQNDKPRRLLLVLDSVLSRGEQDRTSFVVSKTGQLFLKREGFNPHGQSLRRPSVAMADEMTGRGGAVGAYPPRL